jgi:predicted esterase
MGGSLPPDQLVCWSGGLPAELDERGLATLAPRGITLVAGTGDAVVPPAAMERTRAWLAERGREARVIAFEGGHRIDAGALGDVAAAVGGLPPAEDG